MKEKFDTFLLIKSDKALVNSNQTRSLTQAQPSLFMNIDSILYSLKNSLYHLDDVAYILYYPMYVFCLNGDKLRHQPFANNQEDQVRTLYGCEGLTGALVYPGLNVILGEPWYSVALST